MVVQVQTNSHLFLLLMNVLRYIFLECPMKFNLAMYKYIKWNVCLLFQGDFWFKRFGRLGPDDCMIFPTTQEVIDYRNTIWHVDKWSQFTLMNVLRNNDQTKLLNANQIFIAESLEIKVNVDEIMDIVVSHHKYSCRSRQY